MGVLDAGCVSGPNAKKYGLEGPHNVVLWLTFRPQHNAPHELNMHLLCVTPHMGDTVPQHHHVRLHGTLHHDHIMEFHLNLIGVPCPV